MHLLIPTKLTQIDILTMLNNLSSTKQTEYAWSADLTHISFIHQCHLYPTIKHNVSIQTQSKNLGLNLPQNKCITLHQKIMHNSY